MPIRPSTVFGTRPIATMDNDEMCNLLERAIAEGTHMDIRDHEPRKYAEAWLRGWCEAANTTDSFREALVIYLHNYITF